MEPIFTKELTEQQKREMLKLHKAFAIKNFLIGIKNAVAIFAGSFAVVALNILWVHSDIFPFVGSCISTFLCLRLTIAELEANRGKFYKQVVKLIDFKIEDIK